MKTKVPEQCQSINIRRLPNNPQEENCVSKWREENSNLYGEVTYQLLAQILKREPTAEDCQTAETIIQWLGSPVGDGFVAKLNLSQNK